MRELILSLLLIAISFEAFAEKDFKVYFEKTEKGFEVYADNNEFCPISLKISFELLNMKSSKGNNKIFVVPARSKKVSLTQITKIRNGKYKFSYKTRFNYGDHNSSVYDKTFKYNLPFEKGETFKVSQGYNGSFSHQGKNALDFKMDIGTKIMATRKGVVIRVVDTNNKTCPEEDCEKYNNLILIYHTDGTFAEYVHIKRNGAKVKVGDIVEKGQLIAESGNIGRSTGPHLHLVIFIQKIEERRTLKTLFLKNEGNTTGFLKEKKEYLKNYD